MFILQSRVMITAACLVLAWVRLSSAAHTTIPWDVDILLPPVDPAYETAWIVDFPFVGLNAIDVDTAFTFPTEHRPSYAIHLPFEIGITFPDTVAPGQSVDLDVTLSLSGPPSFTTYGAGDFNSTMSMSAEGQGSFDVVNLKDTIGAIVPGGLLWGSWAWQDTDFESDPFTREDPWKTDHFGNTFDWSFGIGLGMTFPEFRATGEHFVNEGTFQAWNVPRLEVLDKLGYVNAQAALINLIYDVYIEADDTIRETSSLLTNMVTAYYTYDGVGPDGYERLYANTGLDKRIDIPWSLNPGDVFEVELTALGLDYSTVHVYEIKGTNEFGAEILGFWDVPAIRIGSEDFFEMRRWSTEHRYFENLIDAPVLQFTVAQDPVCDVDEDGDVDRNDIDAIFAARNTSASGPDDPMDPNGDGLITVNDGRECVLECTNPRCAP